MLLRSSCAIGRPFSSASSSSFSHGARSIFGAPPLLIEALGGRLLLLHSSSVVPVTATMAGVASQQPEVPVTEDKITGEEQAKGLNDQATSSEGITENKDLGNLSVNIMPHILNLYGLTATAADFEIYAPDATFEDPLMKAKGVKQIKSAFYSMPKVFGEGKIAEYSLQENETAPGTGEIRIDNTQHYKVWGKAIDMNSLIKLQIENGKVTRHEDLWDKHPLWTRDTVRVPLVGRATETWRRFNMIVTHVLMGCGKDPSPKT